MPPATGWGDLDRREFACEAAVLLVHDLPLADVVKVADILLRLDKLTTTEKRALAALGVNVQGFELDATVEGLLKAVRSGSGPKPMHNDWPAGTMRTMVSISGRDSFGRGQ